MPVVVGLRLQVDRGIHQVLYPMNDERLAGRSGVELAFHAQDTVAMAVQERRQPDGESGPVDIDIQRQHEGGCLMGVPRAIDSSEERSVGNEGVSTSRSRGAP